MKRSTRNAVRTRSEIIEKSAPIFNVHGFSGTKMQMLVEATGYQMGGIYRHFPTKMALAKEVFDFNYEALVQTNLQVDSSLNPKEKLLRFLKNYRHMILKPPIHGGCPLINTAVEADDTNNELRNAAKGRIKEVLRFIEIIIREGIDLGHFNASLSADKEAQFLFSSIEGAVFLGKSLHDADIILDIFDRIKQHLEKEVFKQE